MGWPFKGAFNGIHAVISFIKFFSLFIFSILTGQIIGLILMRLGVGRRVMAKWPHRGRLGQQSHGFLLRSFPVRLCKKITRSDNAGIFFKILVMVLATRVIIFGGTYLWQIFIKNEIPGFLAFLKTTWYIWDSDHYLFLARHGYAAQGEKACLIVFLPFYPMLIRLFHGVIHNYFLAALAVSNLSLAAAAFFLFKLARLDYDAPTAWRSVKYLLIYPLSFFFSIAYSESAFLFLFIVTVYLLRLRRWPLAGLAALLTVLTRSPHGNFLFLIFLVEALRLDPASSRETQNARARNSAAVGGVILGACLLLGNFVYLLLNKILFGRWFAYLDYMNKHWFHRFVPFSDNLADMVRYTLAWDPSQNLTLWIPGLLSFFIPAVLLLLTAKKLRLAYAVYFLFYLVSSYSVYWLMSGARYVITAFPLFLMLALLSKNKTADSLLTITSTALLMLCAMTLVHGTFLM